MQVRFLGAAGGVTGSRFLVESRGTRVLVDCGLFQGVKNVRRRNWLPLGVEHDTLDAVVLTHAHIDHSGFLPVLVREGFTAPILSTIPTRDLCSVLLPDAGYLQAEDAEYANRHGFSRHTPALPLYDAEDGVAAARAITGVPFHETQTVGALRITFRGAGHILGAASALLESADGTLLVSGDLGRSDDLVMRGPEPLPAVDTVVVESTYGDRLHPEGDPVEAIAEIGRRTFERGGVLLIPAFAVGRSQAVLVALHRAMERHGLPRVPIFLNSPMATEVTALYERHVAHHRLTAGQCDEVLRNVTFVRDVQASKALNDRAGPAVIVSASGMLSGGRVLHHLKSLGPNPRNTILIVGFQAPGTRGDALVNGHRQLKVHGGYVDVRAEVVRLDLLSAHADQGDLLAWLGGAHRPGRVLVVHGEPVASDTLRRRAAETLGLDVDVPELGETIALGARRGHAGVAGRT